MSKMGSHGSFGYLKHKLWAKERPGVKLTVWLPTTKSRESTRFTWLQTTWHIPLESSRWELQLCFRPHFDPRSARKVMGLQSPGSPHWQDFGTPMRESRERKAIWMQAPWRGTEYTIRGKPPSPWRGTKYTIRGKVVASPKFGPWWVLCVRVARGESCVSVLSVVSLVCPCCPWWVLCVRVVRGESCVSVLPMARPSAKGAPTMH
jgi:hypothetical protein